MKDRFIHKGTGKFFYFPIQYSNIQVTDQDAIFKSYFRFLLLSILLEGIDQSVKLFYQNAVGPLDFRIP